MNNKISVILLLSVILFFSGCIVEDTVITGSGGVNYTNASRIESVGLASSSGNNTALISELNGGYWEGVESNTPWKIDISYWLVKNFTFVESTTKYLSIVGTPSNDEVDLEIWCTVHNEFMDLTTLLIHNEWGYFTRHIPDDHKFIQSNGTVWLRYNHTSNGNTNHRIRIDTNRLILKN